MSINSLLKNIAFLIEKRINSVYKFPVEEQKRYLEQIPEPKDDVERSYFQYKCQMKLYGAVLKMLVNLLSVPLIFLYMIKYRSDMETVKISPDDSMKRALFLKNHENDSIIPKELLEAYEISKCESNNLRGRLNSKDIDFIINIWKRYPASFFFVFKCLVKISIYRAAFEDYGCRAIIVCEEFSFTSSMLTSYCHVNNIMHINIMHGEKLFYIRDSFYHFDRFFVWDGYYIELGKKLRAEENQFIVSLPKALQFGINDKYKKRYDYGYYLASEDFAQLNNISKALRSLCQKGYKVKVRPHPIYSDIIVVRKSFEGILIEDTTKVSIEQSLLETKNVIAVASTVLQQAYFNNIGIVIDDISDPSKYESLKSLGYMMITKKHEILSKLIY